MFLRNSEAEHYSRNIGIEIRKQKWLHTIENMFQGSKQAQWKKVLMVKKKNHYSIALSFNLNKIYI